MSWTTFYKELILTSLLCGTTLAALLQHPLLAPYADLAGGASVFFIGFCVLLFQIGKRAMQNPESRFFDSVFLGGTFFKFFLSIGLLFAYRALREPDHDLFILPFFVAYAFFTVFEVRFLSRLAKEG